MLKQEMCVNIKEFYRSERILRTTKNCASSKAFSVQARVGRIDATPQFGLNISRAATASPQLPHSGTRIHPVGASWIGARYGNGLAMGVAATFGVAPYDVGAADIAGTKWNALG